MGSGGNGEVREGILGKIARIEEHLRGVIETKCNRNFLKYIKVILIKSPNNGGDKFQMAISGKQTKIPVPVLGYIQLSCRPKGSHRHLQRIQYLGCCQDNWLFSTTDSQGPLAEGSTHPHDF